MIAYLKQQLSRMNQDIDGHDVLAGCHLSHFTPAMLQKAPVILDINGTRDLLVELWPYMKNLRWIHTTRGAADHLIFQPGL